MKILILIIGIAVFLVGAFVFINEGIKEGSQKAKMMETIHPRPTGGRYYHRSYSIVFGIGCFLAAVYFLYRLLFK